MFSDKTGTLTMNLMRFQKMSVAGKVWIHEPRHDHVVVVDHKAVAFDARAGDHLPGLADSEFGPPCNFNQENGKPAFSTRQLRESTRNSSQVRLFLLGMTLCNTCIVEEDLSGNIAFRGSSPDEVALIRAAQDLGYTVLKRTVDSVTIRVVSEREPAADLQRYDVLNVIEFTSDRQRMSVVVRMPDQRICVFCKGADSVIRRRLRSADSIETDDSFVTDCFGHVDAFASEGLRTLAFAYRYLDQITYDQWQKSYQGAATRFNCQSSVDEVAEEFEQNLVLLGATGIEDRLQEGVPGTISKLQRANIKIWMLTGDKRETAINVGTACGLVRARSEMMVLDSGFRHRHVGCLKAELLRLKERVSDQTTLAIDGRLLAAYDADPAGQDLLIELAGLVQAVICYRTSPGHKALLVRALRRKVPSATILAIGDGGNDVAMIQEAHIGIGIAGKEGMQAARISDYSIAQFRFLQRLLLVHGHWNYVRTCKYVLGTFWKEIFFYLTQALFQHCNAYSGTSLYEAWSLTLFQPLFTSLPVVCIGIFEKDLAASTLLARPELYALGQQSRSFNLRVYLWWAFLAASEAVIVFFMMLKLYGEAAITKDDGLYATGALSFTACVVFISVKLLLLELHSKTATAVVAILFSLGAWFVWMLAISAAYSDNVIYDVRNGFVFRFGRDISWWLTLIGTVVVLILFEILVSCPSKTIWLTEVDVFQRYERDPQFRQRCEREADR
jgi:phospholipid-translocating ATPase